MTDRYIHITAVTIDDLMGRVNAICAIPVTDEGWPCGTAAYKLVTAFPNQSNAYCAVLEKL